MTTSEQTALLTLAAETILSAPIARVQTLWTISDGFDLQRAYAAGIAHDKESVAYLRTAFGLLEVWQREQENLVLRDNALIAIAIALQKGLVGRSDLDEAEAMIFEPPLATEQTRAQLEAILSQLP